MAVAVTRCPYCNRPLAGSICAAHGYVGRKESVPETTNYHVPKGGIIMWSGAIADIPAGWYLCDGTNGTPDLHDRFIVAAGTSYAVGDTGGASSQTLDATQMPVHTHVQNAHNHTQNSHNHAQDAHGHNVGRDGVADGAYNGETNNGGAAYPVQLVGRSAYGPTAFVAINNTATNQAQTATNNEQTATNQNAGGGAAFDNRPYYYALAFIMKG